LQQMKNIIYDYLCQLSFPLYMLRETIHFKQPIIERNEMRKSVTM
jgi:hypothetical protein